MTNYFRDFYDNRCFFLIYNFLSLFVNWGEDLQDEFFNLRPPIYPRDKTERKERHLSNQVEHVRPVSYRLNESDFKRSSNSMFYWDTYCDTYWWTKYAFSVQHFGKHSAHVHCSFGKCVDSFQLCVCALLAINLKLSNFRFGVDWSWSRTYRSSPVHTRFTLRIQ